MKPPVPVLGRARRRAKPSEAPEGAPAPPEAVTGTLAFEGTTALIRLAAAPDLGTMSLDGVILPRPRWRFGDDGTLRAVCPPSAFDGQPHRLRLLWEDDATPPLDLTFRSDYRAAIDVLDDETVTGWIFDALRPASSLTLDVQSGTGPAFAVLNTLDHPDLATSEPTVVGGGFEILLPPRRSRGRAELLSITVRGTGHQPFGPILRGTTLPGAIAAAASAGRGLGVTAPGLLFRSILLPAIVQSLSGSVPRVGRDLLDGATRLRGSHGLPRLAAPLVDVVIPAYRGLGETLACIESVLASGNQVGHRVTVIDDCSPEPALSTALQALAASGRIAYLRNDSNLGFVATANRGMTLDPTADVLLLNSDTLVPAGFLDRIFRAAYSDPCIATVTPLSNNATICSLPLPPGTEATPYGLPLADIDAICAEVNKGAVRDIPTAHGFCMFIKRAALDEVGAFDAAQFGAGYGEENDFSLRCFEHGWRNVCAGDVYVEHTGAVSFGEARAAKLAANLGKVEALYPYYHDFVADFLRTDPLHDVRNRVQKAVWKRSGKQPVLLVTLSLEGGAVRHADDLAERLTAEGFLVLALGQGKDIDSRPMLTIRRRVAAVEEALRYPAPAPMTEALADILDLAPGFIHVQHLLDLPDGIGEFVRDCGIPYAVTLHDFFYGCPKVTLIDEGGEYCGMPPPAKCTLCVRHGPIHASIHGSLTDYARIGEVWRGKWEPLLRDALQLIAPSRDTAARYASLFPGLQVDVRPHFASPRPRIPALRAQPPHTGQRLRVAIPGAIGPQKGARQLVDLARHCSRWDDDILFVVVGHTDREDVLKKYENVRLYGGYAPGEAVTSLVHVRCRVALFLSIFPETYSYTLSESLEAGLVPVGYDFGAIGERLRTLGIGALVPLGAPPAETVAAIRRAATMDVSLSPDAVYGQYDRLVGDYYAPALTDLAESIPPPDLPRLLAWPVGVHRDRWCGGQVSFQVWSARPVARLMLSFWIPKHAQFQTVEILWNGMVLSREPLDEGRVKRVICVIPSRNVRFLDLSCRFDFVVPLAPPDVRAAAAMFSGIEVSDGGPWQGVEVPDWPQRAPQRAPGATEQQAAD
jgi:GT2 family glycosyltransferase/glycosyltransferase involved in cell wall biosynthesis